MLQKDNSDLGVDRYSVRRCLGRTADPAPHRTPAGEHGPIPKTTDEGTSTKRAFAELAGTAGRDLETTAFGGIDPDANVGAL